MRKRRKFADGGVTGQTQQPTYPFYGNQPMAGGQSGGMNQTFNMQPQAMSGPNDQMTQRFAKGGQAKVGKVMSEFKSGKLKSSSGQKVTNPKQAIAIGLSEAGLSKKAKGGEMKESKAMMKKEVSFMKKKGAPKSMLKHEMKEAGMKKGGNVKKMAMGGKIPISPKFAAMLENVQNPKPTTPLPGPKGSPTLSGPRVPKDYVGSGGPMDPTSPGYVRPNYGAVTTSPKPVRGAPIPQGINKPANMSPRNQIRPPVPQGINKPANMSPLPTRGSGPNDAGPGRPGLMKKGGSVKKMASGGLAAGHKSADGVAHKGKTKAMQVKMAKGGATKMRKGGYC